MKKTILVVLTLALAAMGFAQRLPETAVPSNYQLRFAPNFQDNTFDGDEVITVKLLKPTKSITLNAAEIEFKDVTITTGSLSQKAKATSDEASEMVTLTVDRELPAAEAKIAINYKGQLNDKLRGFYLSKTEKRKYAATQFEATDARRAFPCWDEPAYKATYDISVVADKDDTAISNSKIASDTAGPGEKHTIKFATTPRMSTYLVALLVGDWKCLSDEVDGIPLRVCAVPGKEQMGRFALDATKAVVSYFNKYYGIKYPFGKLDQIAVPDFEAGAMENTGAITYRETALLIDDKTSSEFSKRNVAQVISHEIAHQWFGDLVTMKWWNDIWLNEGFATWMEDKPLEDWKPEWKIRLGEIQGTNSSISGDSVVSTRPIRQNAETKGEINALFDGIAYGKTAAVLRMLESYLGEETFRKGVNDYLKAHAYGNATAEDFFGAMAKASGKPVDKLMATFVTQPGVPYVDLKAKCANGKTQITASQKRYFYDPALFEKDTDQLWQIPLCMKSVAKDGSTIASKCELLTQKTQQFTFDGCAAAVFPNAGGVGYYRYAFSPQEFADVQGGMEKSLAPAELISAESNEWALVRAGQQDVTQYLAMADGLRNSRVEPVFDDVLTRVTYIYRNLVGEADRPAFQAWVRDYARPLMNEVGYTPKPGEPKEYKELRSTLISAMGNTGEDPETIAKSREMTQMYMNDAASVDATTARAFMSIAAAHGDRKLYEEFRAALKNAETPDVYYTYFYSLVSFRDPALLKQTLEMVLTPEVRNQDMHIISSVMGNRFGGAMPWEWVKSHWDELRNKAGGSIGGTGMLIGGTSNFCDSGVREDVKKFIEAHPVQGTQRAFRQSQEQIRYCVDMKQRQEPKLAQWLKANRGIGQSGDSVTGTTTKN